MSENTYVQPTGLSDVRKQQRPGLPARLSLAIVSSGCAGALLLSSFFSAHASAAPVSRANLVRAESAIISIRAQSPEMDMALLSHEASGANYRTIARRAAAHYGISPTLFERQINQESGFNPRAISAAGAQGIAQFMPATAASLGIDPWDPVDSLWGAANLMAQLNHQFSSNYAKALAAYNAGAGTVQHAVRAGGSNWYSYLPAETQNYIRVIMDW